MKFVFHLNLITIDGQEAFFLTSDIATMTGWVKQNLTTGCVCS
jgi:hypothetical protein